MNWNQSDSKISTATLEEAAESGEPLDVLGIYDTKEDRIQILRDMYKMYSLTKFADITGVNKSLLSEFFSGKKNISRIPLIRIFIALKYDYKTVQRYLRRFKCASLYVKNRWDIIVINGISHTIICIFGKEIYNSSHIDYDHPAFFEHSSEADAHSE